jgi:Zn-dependent protease with chaperone function
MAQEARSLPRLNPFALPSETSVRFILLLLMSLALATDVGSLVASLIIGDAINSAVDEVVVYTQGVSLIPHAVTFRLLSVIVLDWLIVLGYIVIVFSLGVILYLRHPSRIRRQMRLRPLDPVSAAHRPFYTRILSFAQGIGIQPPATLEIAPGTDTDAQVFGVRKRHALRLGGGLPKQMIEKPDQFCSTILHEFGHIVNGDVGRYYFTRAISLSVGYTVVIPGFLLISGLFFRAIIVRTLDGNWARLFFINIPQLAVMFIQLAVSVCVFFLIQRSLLRVREYYADWRAALWGSEHGLREMILEQLANEKPRPFWERLVRQHPSVLERRSALDSPDRLFRLTHDVSFFGGIALACVIATLISHTVDMLVAVQSVNSLMASTLRDVSGVTLLLWIITIVGSALFYIVPYGMLMVAMCLASGILGNEVEREALAGMSRGKVRGPLPYLRLLLPASLFVAGMQIGFMTGLASVFFPTNLLIVYEGSLLPLVLIPFETGLWIVVAILVIWVWLAYARFFAHRILGTHFAQDAPNRKRHLLTVQLSILLGFILVPLLISQSQIYRNVGGIYQFGLGTPMILFLIALMIVFAMWLFTWVLIAVIKALWPPKCPICNTRAHARFHVGYNCHVCGSTLAPWLFVTTSDN